jgi:hypothetical protein
VKSLVSSHRIVNRGQRLYRHKAVQKVDYDRSPDKGKVYGAAGLTQQLQRTSFPVFEAVLLDC